jgi:hypothetical protein
MLFGKPWELTDFYIILLGYNSKYYFRVTKKIQK